MPADAAWVYPPAPINVPSDLAKPGLGYQLRVFLVLLSLLLVLLFYLALMAGSLALMCWVIWPVFDGFTSLGNSWYTRLIVLLLRSSFFVVAALMFVFLLKGLFKRGDGIPAYLEVTESKQPDLFQFLHSVCREIGCAVPQRVFLSHDVDAAVLSSTSLVNLFVPPHKDLLIGLGLVNGLNLAEFKALLAHELGHYSQRTVWIGSYVSVVHQVIANMVIARDRWDDWVIRGFDTPWASGFALPLYVVAELTRTVLSRAFRLLAFADASLRRQMEFNADLVAVSVAGSDALTHLLFKCEFWNTCFYQAADDLALPADQGLFTRDFYYHQLRASELLRKSLQQPALGQLPDLPSDPTCRGADIFQPGEVSKASMWETHPPNYDREQNAKRRYFRSPLNDQSAWLLFHDCDALRIEATHIFYCNHLKVEPDEPFVEPDRVKTFIDEERTSTTFDPRYRGIYDNRLLELLDLNVPVSADFEEAVNDSNLLLSSVRELYSDELEHWVASHRCRRQEFDQVDGLCSGRLLGAEFDFRGQRYPIGKASTILAELKVEMNEDRRYLAEFDNSVFQLHQQLAMRQGREPEWRARYECHLRLQKMLEIIWEQKDRTDSVLHFIYSRKVLEWAVISQLQETMSQVEVQIKEFMKQADDLMLPPLKNLEESESVAFYLPETVSSDLVVRDDYATISVARLERFSHWLTDTSGKLQWLHRKSLRGILDLHEVLAAQEATAPGLVTRAPHPGKYEPPNTAI